MGYGWYNSEGCITPRNIRLGFFATFIPFLIALVSVTITPNHACGQELQVAAEKEVFQTLASSDIPLLDSQDERNYVGEGLYLPGGVPIDPLVHGIIPPIIIYRLVTDKLPRVSNEYGSLVPHVVEMRLNVPGVESHKLPLLQMIWDADGDGLGDYLGVVSYSRSGERVIQITPLEGSAKPKMDTLGYFPLVAFPELEPKGGA